MDLMEIKEFVAGVTLGGWRQASGILNPQGMPNCTLPDWPEEIQIESVWYTRERVDQGRTEKNATWENAEYV